MVSKDFFKGKRVAVVGIGPHGELVSDIKFLIKNGALVSIYDMKSEARLKKYLIMLRTLGLANYVCGSIPEDDLLDMDLIILSHEYPRSSSFLIPATAKGVKIEYQETLFFKLAPPVTFVGILGSCGKSSVMSFLSPMLEAACSEAEGQGFFVFDPDGQDGILSCLRKIRNGDVVLVRVVDFIAHELYLMRISPHVAVFSSTPSGIHYSKSPYEILEYQTYNNYVIASDRDIDLIKESGFQPRSKMIRTKSSIIPDDWKPDDKSVSSKKSRSVPTPWRKHDRDNAALALEAARLFRLNDDKAEGVIRKWKPLKGRMEHVKTIKGVEFYNDTTAVNPVATIIALETLADGKNTILILGGSRGSSDYNALYAMFTQNLKTLILLPGSGTMVERKNITKIDIETYSVPSIEEAVRISVEKSTKGDKVIFSPAFSCGGAYDSEKERGEVFVRSVRAI